MIYVIENRKTKARRLFSSFSDAFIEYKYMKCIGRSVRLITKRG